MMLWYVAWGWVAVLAAVPVFAALAVTVVLSWRAREVSWAPKWPGLDGGRVTGPWAATVLLTPLLGGVAGVALMIGPIAIPATRSAALDAFGPGVFSIFSVLLKAAFAGLVGVESAALAALVGALVWAVPVDDEVASGRVPHPRKNWMQFASLTATAWCAAALICWLLVLYLYGGDLGMWFRVMTQMGEGLAR